MRKLNFDDLKAGQPGVSEKAAAFLVEAAIVCLELNGHQSGVILQVTGDYKENFQLFWTDKLTEQITKSWKDLKEAAEYGATAIALLLVNKLESLIVKERLEQAEEADYSLQNIKDDTTIALLEVSGLMKEKPTNTVSARVQAKQSKLNKSRLKHKFEPVIIIVTEFGIPKTKIKENE